MKVIRYPEAGIEDKVKMILKLIKDGDLVMDGTLEEILKREPLAELVKDIGSITNELNVLQNKVESLEHQKSDLEAQNVEKVKENSKLTTEIQRMKEEADRKILEQVTLVEDKINLASQLGNLKEKSEKLEAKVKEEESEKLKAKDAAENLKKQILEFEMKSRESEKEISKTEIEDKVKSILKLIKDGDLVMDGTLEEILKMEPLAELVEELNVLQNKVESLERQKSDLEAQNVEKVDEYSKLTTEIQRMKEEVEGKILEQKRLTEVCLNGINSLNNEFSANDKDDKNSITEIRRGLLLVKEDFSEMKREMGKLQDKVGEEESNKLEIERENSTCLNQIRSLTEEVSKQGEHSLGLQNKIYELEEKLISQKNPPKAKIFSIGNLTYISFIHMLILSFFVNAELLPTHEAFRDKSVHPTLYSMTVFFEVFFASVFFIAARYQQESSIEYFGLMMANLILSCHMTAMIHKYLSIFTAIWWLLGLAVTAFHIGSKELGSKNKKEQIL